MFLLLCWTMAQPRGRGSEAQEALHKVARWIDSIRYGYSQARKRSCQQCRTFAAQTWRDIGHRSTRKSAWRDEKQEAMFVGTNWSQVAWQNNWRRGRREQGRLSASEANAQSTRRAGVSRTKCVKRRLKSVCDERQMIVDEDPENVWP